MENKFLKYLTKNLLEDVSKNGILTTCLIFFVTLLVIYWKFGKKKYKLPPGPTGVPILGYIPFLGKEPYKELDRLKKIYGNVFSLYLGRSFVVILGDYEAVKDAFSQSATTDRPSRLFDFLPNGVGFSSVNGEEWVEQRKFCVKSMKDLGLGKTKWETLVQDEVVDFVQLVSSFNGEPIDICKHLTSSVSNNISSFIFGKRFSTDHPYREFLDDVLNDISASFKQSSVSNFFPIIRDISTTLGIGEFAKVFPRLKKFSDFFKKEAEKFRESQKRGEHDNFIVRYLNEMDNHRDKSRHYFNETNLSGNIQALFIGGSDTTRNSISWLLLIMATFPDIQEKVHQEVDSVLNKDEKIRWSERKKLPYTFATIMEGQRWRSIAPLNTIRMAIEDTKIQNYDIPKGTYIIANNWGLHHDPKYWKEPEKFDPERFLSADGKEVITKHDSYVPFSYGKRNCPGEMIAMMEILVYFTALMQKFTVLPPEGKKPNLNGHLGLTYVPYAQKLCFVPRN